LHETIFFMEVHCEYKLWEGAAIFAYFKLNKSVLKQYTLSDFVWLVLLSTPPSKFDKKLILYIKYYLFSIYE